MISWHNLYFSQKNKQICFAYLLDFFVLMIFTHNKVLAPFFFAHFKQHIIFKYNHKNLLTIAMLNKEVLSIEFFITSLYKRGA